VPEERGRAAFGHLTMREKPVVASIHRLARWRWLDPRRERSEAARMVGALAVKTPTPTPTQPTPEEPRLRRPGGTQQTVIVGRWPMREVPIRILDDPTSGVDVGANKTISARIAQITARGGPVVIASPEPKGLLPIADRRMDPHAGRVAGTLARGSLPQRRVTGPAAPGDREGPAGSAGARVEQAPDPAPGRPGGRHAEGT
jgi:ABC-type sugar transport system ATPase subunit